MQLSRFLCPISSNGLFPFFTLSFFLYILYVEDIVWRQGDRKFLFKNTLRVSEENQQNSFHHKNRNFVSLGGQDYTLILYSLPTILENRWCLKSIYLQQRHVLDVWVQVYVYKYIIHKHYTVKFFVQKVRLSRGSLVGANIHLKVIG